MDVRQVDTIAIVERITALVTSLIKRNKALESEVDDLRDQIEGLTTKLTALKADNHTQNQEAKKAQSLLDFEAERDNQRLKRLRAELDQYLSEIDRRLEATPTNVDNT